MDKAWFRNCLEIIENSFILHHSRVIISLKRTLEGKFLELVFQDDGPGVPEGSLEQIFDSFYRVDDSRNSAEKGSGIGLAVVKEIVLGHGGTGESESGIFKGYPVRPGVGMDSLGDAATVTVHINRLRDKLGKNDSKNQFIETVWGAGYRFRID